MHSFLHRLLYWQLRTAPPGNMPRRLNLAQQDKDDLLAFLKTLTDRKMVVDIKFSNPFKQ